MLIIRIRLYLVKYFLYLFCVFSTDRTNLYTLLRQIPPSGVPLSPRHVQKGRTERTRRRKKKKPDKICKNTLTLKTNPDIITIVKGNPDKFTGQEVTEMEIDSMTQTELASYLETLAKLVEATAKDPQDAARIIREAIPKQ